MKIINFKKKKMKLLTKEQQESYGNANICYICKGKFENKYLKNKEHRKVVGKYRGATHSICNSKYSVPKTIPIILHKYACVHLGFLGRRGLNFEMEANL